MVSQLLRALWESKEKVQAGLEDKSVAIMEDGGVATPATNHHHNQMNALKVSTFYREAELSIELSELEIENPKVLKSLERLKILLRTEGHSAIHDGDRRLEFSEWMEAAKDHAPFSVEVMNELERVRKIAARELRGTRPEQSAE